MLHYKKQLSIFGLNPGIIHTNIRAPVLGKGLLFNIVEGLISRFTISPGEYGRRVAELMISEDFAKAAADKSGMFLNQKLCEVEKSALSTDDNIHRMIESSKALIDRALSVTK